MGLFSNGGARSGASDLVLSAPRHFGARDRKRKFKARLLFGYFLVAAISLVPMVAQAQFVCGGSANGGEPQSGALGRPITPRTWPADLPRPPLGISRPL
jgi:hypothetical protein